MRRPWVVASGIMGRRDGQDKQELRHFAMATVLLGGAAERSGSPSLTVVHGEDPPEPLDIGHAPWRLQPFAGR